jgi:hypothetical protein
VLDDTERLGVAFAPIAPRLPVEPGPSPNRVESIDADAPVPGSSDMAISAVTLYFECADHARLDWCIGVNQAGRARS